MTAAQIAVHHLTGFFTGMKSCTACGTPAACVEVAA